MAKRKFLLAIGQSNSTAIGDATSWEDLYPQVALRNPQVQATQYSEGSYTDNLTLPYTFPGGPQTKRLGDGLKPSAWQNVNCKGRTVTALRFLTFYAPLPTNFNLGVSYSFKYPGTLTVSSGSSASTLVTTQRWQTSPAGVQLRRKTTNELYTITSTTANTNTITVSPDIFPLPVAGEEFEFTISGGANGTTSTVVLSAQFGGINDLGSALQGPYLPRTVVNPQNYSGSFNPCRLHLLDREVRLGQGVFLQPNIDSFAILAAASGSSNIVFNSAIAESVFPVGQSVSFSTLGTLPTPIVTDRSYYVVYSSGNTIRVADTQGGTAIVFSSSASTGDCVVQQSLPNGLQANVEYYVNSKGPSNQTIPVQSFDTGTNRILTSAPHKLANNDVVRFSTDSTPLLANQNYYVTVASNTQFSVSYTPGGAAIDLTVSHLAGLQIIKPYSYGEYFLRRPTTQSVASVDNAADTITLAAGHFMTVGDTVQFAAGVGGTLPGGIAAATNYKILTVTDPPLYRTITLENPASPGNALPITSNGTLPITMTQTGGQEELSCDGTVTVGTYLLEQWRGSFSGLMLRCTSGANVGQSRVMSHIRYDANNLRGVIELGSPFSSATQSADTYVIEPPSQAGLTIPFHKWAMWLPWCPFEGQAVGISSLTGQISSSANSQIVFSQAANELWKNTEVQFYASEDTVEVHDVCLAGSTATTIQATVTLSGTYAFKHVKFVTGALRGQIRQIQSHTTSQIVFDQAFSAAPQAGDLYQIITYRMHPQIERGRSYYTTYAPGPFYFSSTYNGSDLVGQFSFAATVECVIQNQRGKTNPYPPGFNYPNHLTPVPGFYQAYDGPGFLTQPRIGHYVSTALKMHDYLGEVINVIPLAFGGSGVSHKEDLLGIADAGAGDAWWDPDQQISWSPGDPNNCYGRLMDVLDAAKLAFAAEGDTGECIGIVWAQGEEDGSFEDRANRYAYNCTTLKAAIRQAIKDKGLFSGSPHKIPWIHPKIRSTPWTYAEELNQQIDSMVEADSYMRTFSVDDLPLIDAVHYSGAGMSMLSERAFEAWVSVQRMGTSEVDICNLALANIGETAKVTSIDPPDGSAQAGLCATFYPLARDSLLQMGYWSFAIKRKALVEVDNPRTEWQYAYAVPADASGIIAVTPPDASNDYIEYGMDVPQKFVIETDIHGKRVLYTNQKEAHARYNAKVVDTTLFSTIFTIALSWHLASMLAGPIIKGDVGAAESKRCAQVASAYMAQAKNHDTTTQAEIKPPHTPSWINWR